MEVESDTLQEVFVHFLVNVCFAVYIYMFLKIYNAQSLNFDKFEDIKCSLGSMLT